MYFWYISHVFQNTHWPYIIHEMDRFACVLMCFNVFSCVFTVFFLQKHVLFVRFTFLHEIYCFVTVFMCVHCVLIAETCIYGLFYLYTRIHMQYTLYLKCIILLVFSCVFTLFFLQKHILFGIFYIYTHKLYLIHEMHYFVSVFMCFHCILLQKHVGLEYFACIQEYTCSILYTWNALFC
jgi:hypothetical protein